MIMTTKTITTQEELNNLRRVEEVHVNLKSLLFHTTLVVGVFLGSFLLLLDLPYFTFAVWSSLIILIIIWILLDMDPIRYDYDNKNNNNTKRWRF